MKNKFGDLGLGDIFKGGWFGCSGVYCKVETSSELNACPWDVKNLIPNRERLIFVDPDETIEFLESFYSINSNLFINKGGVEMNNNNNNKECEKGRKYIVTKLILKIHSECELTKDEILNLLEFNIGGNTVPVGNTQFVVEVKHSSGGF